MPESGTSTLADPSAAVSDMMADLARRNPQLAMLTQLLQARAAPPTSADDHPEDNEVEVLSARLVETEARLEAARQQGRKLLAVHRAACERLADLAAAFGACGLCWGEDAGCPSCRGRGRPGMVRPDLEVRARVLGRSAAASRADPQPM